MKQEMMNVLFYIIKTRTLKNGEAPILIRVTIEGSYSDIPHQPERKNRVMGCEAGMCRGKSRRSE